MHCFWVVTRSVAQALVLKFLSTTLVVLYDYAVDYVIFVEEAHWYPELSHVAIRLCLLQTFYSEIITDPHDVFPLMPPRFGSTMQPVFAADPTINMDRDGDHDITDLAFFFLFTVRGLDAKLLWRGADGKSSRISFSPSEGIRLNHDR